MVPAEATVAVRVRAPDDLHKADISGGTHDLVLPDKALDPRIEGVSKQPDVTLVACLRQFLRADGFPGLAAQSDVTPWLAGLTEDLEAF